MLAEVAPRHTLGVAPTLIEGNELTVTVEVALVAVLQLEPVKETETLYAPADIVGTKVGEVAEEPVVVAMPGPLQV